MTIKENKPSSTQMELAGQISRLTTESAIAAAPIPRMENAAPLTRLEASKARKAMAKGLSKARRKFMRRKQAAKRRLHRRR